MSDFVHRIVAGVAEPGAADPVIDAAAQVARHAGAALHLVHAYELPSLLTLTPGLEAAFPQGAQHYEAMLRDRLQATADRLPDDVEVAVHLVRGPAAQSLVRIAAEVEADLLVVGAARRARLARAVLGTTAERVLRAASVPVLVARRTPVLPPQRVLLTTDLSEQSAAVHEAGLTTIDAFLGAPARVRSLLVVAWSESPPPLPMNAVEHVAAEQLAAFLRERAAGGGRVEPAVRVGFAADEIVGELWAWNADLLVVGTHARGWGARLVLGSVAQAALRDAPCNVLAVPPRRIAAVAAASRSEWEESPELSEWLQANA
jgi:nucleotide-binding universal stress UspA family protein